jgi:NAD(P)H-dependent FMN reductase
MSKINIVSGTDRPGSNALKISEYLKPKYEAEGAEVEVISLKDFPISSVAGGVYGKVIPEIKAFNERFLSGDGVVFVVPEYNGGFPGILKLMIDYLPHPKSMDHLPVAFIGESAGPFGALRPIEQLQLICNYRNAFNFPERVFISDVNKQFDSETGLKNDFIQNLLDQQTKNFVTFVEQMKQNVKEMSTLTSG